MFAGPNGSGKTTVKNGLGKSAAWFGLYINPDDLEKKLRSNGVLDLSPFGVTTSTTELRDWFASSEFLKKTKLDEAANRLECIDNKLHLHDLKMNSYYAAVLSDFLRRRLLEISHSFSFETVMSSTDKVGLLSAAQKKGFRTYLYYVATENPSINIERVRLRVAEGGHDVPVEKIVSRYSRSLDLLREAIRFTNRAYFFDASGEEPSFFAEITDGIEIETKSDKIPDWFKKSVWDKF